MSFASTRRRCLGLAASWLLVRHATAQARQRIQVGPQREVRTIAEAARLAGPGALVEVDAGTYAADVAVWTQDGLSIRAVGGVAHLVAAGASAEGKAIWVMRGGRIDIEGFQFSDARVRSRNGGGIRLEAGSLRVSRCRFVDNETGILSSNLASVELEVEDSEFANNGAGDGQSHHLYAGAIARLVVRGSYFHHGNVGHLLKSRAAFNDIRYNRLTDEAGGRASYELEFPNGGVAVVVGNIIAQSERTENPLMLSFGVEGYRRPRNALIMAHNTLVDDKPAGGGFLRVSPGDVEVVVANNLFVGPGRLDVPASAELSNNAASPSRVAAFEQSGGDGFMPGLGVIPRVVDVTTSMGIDAKPLAQFAAPVGRTRLAREPSHPGAVQP